MKLYSGKGIGVNGDATTFGYGVSPDGDIRGVYSGVKGANKEIMIDAIANGGKKLDAYAYNSETGELGSLAHIYHKSGFEPVARVPFDARWASDGFEARNGRLDIVAYKHNGDTADQVAAKYGTYPSPTKAQYDALPAMEYDEAIAYRDSIIGQG